MGQVSGNPAVPAEERWLATPRNDIGSNFLVQCPGQRAQEVKLRVTGGSGRPGCPHPMGRSGGECARGSERRFTSTLLEGLMAPGDLSHRESHWSERNLLLRASAFLYRQTFHLPRELSPSSINNLTVATQGQGPRLHSWAPPTVVV